MEFCEDYIKDYDKTKFLGKVRHVLQEFVRFSEKTLLAKIKFI